MDRTLEREAPRTERLAWIDATRGFCVCAVVLFHVVLWHYEPLMAGSSAAASKGWDIVNSALGSVRMPVLLAVSGLLMARQLRGTVQAHGGVATRIVLARSAANYYLYAVWLAVYLLFFTVLDQPYLRHRIHGLRDYFTQLLVPDTPLWYLFALAVYSMALLAVRRVPAWAVLVVLGATTAVLHGQASAGEIWAKTPELFFFFAVGVYGADLLRRMAAEASVMRLGRVALAAGALVLMGNRVHDPWLDGLIFVPRGLIFTAFAVLAVAVVSRWSPMRRLGVALGHQTLAVYVLHPLWLALLMIAAAGPGRQWIERATDNSVGSALYPLVVTSAIVALSLPARGLAQRARVGALFQMPRPLARRIGG